MFTAAGAGLLRAGGTEPAPLVGPRAPRREGSCTQNPPSAGPGERQAKGSAGATAAEGLHGAGVLGGCSQSPLGGPPPGLYLALRGEGRELGLHSVAVLG